jgi:ubiquinone/menaquinone biosynthesis C-methylase UbiE
MRFGEQRTLPSRYGAAERVLYRAMGVADPAHYLHALYFRRTLASLRELRPERILDAGCGRGDYAFYLARRYPGARVLGVDVDAELIERNRATARGLGVRNAEFRLADLTRLEEVAEFDLVVSVDVLEHIRDQPAALARLARALRPGGAAFYHIPTVRPRPVPLAGRLAAFHAWGEEEHVARESTADEFADAVRRSGLRVVRARPTFGRWTGELATSLFAVGFEPTPGNRLYQGAVAPLCRVLALADLLGVERTRYAVAVLARKPVPAAAPAPLAPLPAGSLART